MKKITILVTIVSLLGALLTCISGCAHIENSNSVFLDSIDEAQRKNQEKQRELLLERDSLIEQYKDCKELEKKIISSLNTDEREWYDSLNIEFRKRNTETMTELLNTTAPLLVSAGNPRGLLTDWWNSPLAYRAGLKSNRAHRELMLKAYIRGEAQNSILQLWEKEYEIRDCADELLFESMRYNYATERLIDKWRGDMRGEAPSQMSPQQSAMLQVFLQEQYDVNNHLNTVMQFWNYQESFGFDDYFKPLWQQKEPLTSPEDKITK